MTLHATGIAKAFGDGDGRVEVLAGVDVMAEGDETVAVLGPSGCGKTTLLRILAGFEVADAGTVRWDGERVSGPSPDRGMVAQAGGLFPWLSLADNLAWGPRAAGRDDVDDVVARLIADTGLDGFEDALPSQLSGGMRQRAAIAQVLANQPPLLLLDEPFGALDAQTRLLMHEWLRGLLQRRSTAVVLVTHDVDEALLLADRVVLLSNRPATVIDRIDVPLGADRGRDTLTDPAFTALKAEVLGRVLGA